jgi:hypothetical protein
LKGVCHRAPKADGLVTNCDDGIIDLDLWVMDEERCAGMHRAPTKATAALVELFWCLKVFEEEGCQARRQPTYSASLVAFYDGGHVGPEGHFERQASHREW